MPAADPVEKQTALPRVLAFVVLVFLITLSVEEALARLNPVVNGWLYLGGGLAISCSPAAAAWLAGRWTGRDFVEVGWKLPSLRFCAISYAVPLGYSLVSYGLAWISGYAGLVKGPELHSLLSPWGLGGLPPALGVLGLVLISATVGWLRGCVQALGEELGWRGFLAPELAKWLPFPGVAALSGLIWAVWHYPLILFAGCGGNTPLWWGLPCFTAVIVAISFPLTWLRLKSGSVWTGVIFHSSHNLFILGLFEPLTRDTGLTPYVVSEFGIATVICTGATAWCFRRCELP